MHLSLPDRLRAARKAAGLSQRKLAARAGLSDTAVLYIEGGRVPGVDTVEKIARALNVPPCWLGFGPHGNEVFREKVPGGAMPADTLPAPAAQVALDVPLTCDGLPSRLQLAQKARAISRRALSRASEVLSSSILNYEAGRNVPSVATVERLALALGVSPCWLAYGEGEGPAGS